MTNEQRLARDVYRYLENGAMDPDSRGTIAPFEPEGEDAYVDLTWQDGETDRNVRITFEFFED